MKQYKTQQREALLSFFMNNPERKLSPDDILCELPAELKISRSAVYRNLDRMASDGLLERSAAAEGRKTLYQYAGRERDCGRVHLRCERCGSVFHMEREADEQKLDVLLKQNGLQLDGRATVILGVCRGCRYSGEE